MILRTLVWMLLLAAALGAALWWQRDHPAVQRLLPGVVSKLPPALTAPAGAPAAAAVGGRLRKCRSGGQLLYTDGACPPGSREEAADGGTVTVLPAVKPAAASAAAAPASAPAASAATAVAATSAPASSGDRHAVSPRARIPCC